MCSSDLTESSTGVARGIRWAEHRKEISAHQYVGMGAGAASGLALVAHSDMGYINVSRWSPNLFYAGGSSGIQMSSTAVTIAATPTIGDFAVVAGVQFLSGDSYVDTDGLVVGAGTLGAPGAGTELGAATFKQVSTKATGIDAQAHGEVAGMEAGFYGAYAKGDAGANSFYGDKKAATIGADFTVIPHTLSLGAAYRNAKNGTANDNAYTLTAIYDLAQNVALHADFTKYSEKQGLKVKNADTGETKFVGGSFDNLVTLMLEAAW